MKYRSFQGQQVAEIGLGTWQLGSSDWGEISEDAAFAILQTYTDGGGNFIDTADVYGMGTSERMVGRFIKSTKQELFVATKLGRRQDKPFGWPQNFSYDMMRQQVEASLKNLDLPQIFLEQLHCIPTEVLASGAIFDSLRKLQQEKLIRYWGVSVETSEEALICLEQEGLASLQIIFTLCKSSRKRSGPHHTCAAGQRIVNGQIQCPYKICRKRPQELQCGWRSVQCG